MILSKKKAEWTKKKQATLEILDECPSYNEERLPEFCKRMEFPVSKNLRTQTDRILDVFNLGREYSRPCFFSAPMIFKNLANPYTS